MGRKTKVSTYSDSKLNKFKQVAEYILDSEHEDYINWCQENDLDHTNIKGPEQRKHVYAIAMVALGYSFVE